MSGDRTTFVQDESTNNPHYAQTVNGELKALCNRRYRVYAISSDYGQSVWAWAACPRCEAKAAKAATA